MPKRQMKHTFEERCELVERCINNEISIARAGETLGVSPSAINRWIMLYENCGPTALLPMSKNTHYPKELKRAAVLDYLDGFGSLVDIAKKYGLRNKSQLQDWLKVYNTHKDFKTERGGSAMSRSHTKKIDERLEIVLDCLANEKNYGAMAQKYRVSYQNVYQWVARYEKLGKSGLEDRRGRRKGTLPSRTPEETLQDELAQLKRENQRLQMELDVTKKFQELERRNRWQK
ncbi:helix-turn-helix domain-containing protein [Jeotgalibaca caeni]|uniref:helix-turn-helix domain-containing protein n=1 Tax=Jeotgalibaca caeni TaxID=3028623 RepID=UPI00237E2DB6|nr:helix-turn-helix domain-containing protein [Jeotgalibaca caeni]MDE1550048.1 helix-turn-helix domain-containing protein [Jeotgalibaca caeni]